MSLKLRKDAVLWIRRDTAQHIAQLQDHWCMCRIGLHSRSELVYYEDGANLLHRYANTCANSCMLFLVQVRLRTEVLCTPSSTWPGFELMTPDHDSTFHVTETFALTTRPSETYCHAHQWYCRTDPSSRTRMRYFWIKYDLGQKYYAPKFDPPGIRIHDLQIMTVHFMSLRHLL